MSFAPVAGTLGVFLGVFERTPSFTARADCGNEGVTAEPARDRAPAGLVGELAGALPELGGAEDGAADDGRVVRVAARVPRVADEGPDAAGPESDAAEDPAEPVVSAAAMAGSDRTAAPTPRATARAPTRPT